MSDEGNDAPPEHSMVRRQHNGAARLPICGAKTRAGTPCRQPGGFKTDHVGQGRCNLHGGKTPVKSGRYSKINRPRIRDLIEAHAADDAPLDTLPELAAARALFQDFVERYDENHDAVLAWHAQQRVNPEQQEALYAALNELQELQTSGGVEFTDVQSKRLADARSAVALLGDDVARPKVLLDISDAYRIVSEITRIVERIEKARPSDSIAYEQLKRFLFGFERVLQARINDPALLALIQTDLLAVNL